MNSPNPSKNDIIHAVAVSLQNIDLFAAQPPHLSRRMFHEKIAAQIAKAMEETLHAQTKAWAVYGGKDNWSYNVVCGKYVLCLNPKG